MNRVLSIQEVAALDLKALLTAAGNLPASGVLGGPPGDAQMKAGVVEITNTGPIYPNLYVPLIDVRIQIRCLHNRLEAAEQISQAVHNAWHQVGRRTVTDAAGVKRLVHLTNIIAGFSQHYDTAETWEYLGFAQFLIDPTPLA